jgi:hypothetical protein
MLARLRKVIAGVLFDSTNYDVLHYRKESVAAGTYTIY